MSIPVDGGDAEQLPYATGEFRTVVTMFGAMLAARPERAAVGGRIAMAAGRRRASSARCSG